VIRYKCILREPWVVAVECEVLGYPNLDADGQTQFENTHFENEVAAWERLLRNTAAAQSDATANFDSAKKHMQERTNELAERAAVHSHAFEAFQEFSRNAMSAFEESVRRTSRTKK